MNYRTPTEQGLMEHITQLEDTITRSQKLCALLKVRIAKLQLDAWCEAAQALLEARTK